MLLRGDGRVTILTSCLQPNIMPAYIIVDIAIHDAATYEEYKLLAPPSIAQYGGRYIARGGNTDVLEARCHEARMRVTLTFVAIEVSA